MRLDLQALASGASQASLNPNSPYKKATLQVPAGKLDTTKSPQAVEGTNLVQLHNCINRRGKFERDWRYRQWATAPDAGGSQRRQSAVVDYSTLVTNGTTWGSVGDVTKLPTLYNASYSTLITNGAYALSDSDTDAAASWSWSPQVYPGFCLILQNFGFAIPANAQIVTLTFTYRWKSTGTPGYTGTMNFDLTKYADGTKWLDGVAPVLDINSGAFATRSDQMSSVAGITPSIVNDPNFGIRITSVAPGKSCTFYLDYAKIEITYTTPADVSALKYKDDVCERLTSSSSASFVLGGFSATLDPAATSVTGYQVEWWSYAVSGNVTVQFEDVDGNLIGESRTLAMRGINFPAFVGKFDDSWGGLTMLPGTTGAPAKIKFSWPDGQNDRIDMVRIVCYTIATGQSVKAGEGMVLGKIGTPTDPNTGVAATISEVDVATGEGIFTCLAAEIDLASHGPWASTPLYNLNTIGRQWATWQYDDKVFFANNLVFFKKIGENFVSILYNDYVSPGGGGVVVDVHRAPYDLVTYDPASDTAAWVSSGGITWSPAPTVSVHDDKTILVAAPKNSGTNSGWMKITITFANTKDWSNVGYIGIRCSGESAVKTDGTLTHGMHSKYAANAQIRIKSNADGYAAACKSKHMALDAANLVIGSGTTGDRSDAGYLWFTVEPASGSVTLTDVKEVEIVIPVFETAGSATLNYELNLFTLGGKYYKKTGTSDIDVNTSSVYLKSPVLNPTTESIQYAWDVTESGSTLQPVAVKEVQAKDHLGDTAYGYLPKMGSIVTLHVPVADAPWTSSAVRRLYRRVGTDWWRIATQSNASTWDYVDSLTDQDIRANVGGTYVQVGQMDIKPHEPKDSGAVDEVVCGAPWKGHIVYGTVDGCVRFSQQSDWRVVPWRNIDIEILDTDAGRARAMQLTYKHKLPVQAIVPQDAVFLFTAADAWVIKGDTAASASLPFAIEGSVGIVGKRAACAYGRGALYGGLLGLYFCEVPYGWLGETQTIKTQEVTANQRDSWKWLLGDAADELVVAAWLDKVWAFCEDRYMFIWAGDVNTGRWANGAEVVDAKTDPDRGVVVQFTDGTMGVVGEFVQDGATDVDGTSGGVSPQWSVLTRQEPTPCKPLRARVQGDFPDGHSVQIRMIGDRVQTEPIVFDKDSSNTKPWTERRPLGRYVQVEIIGTAEAVVSHAEVDVAVAADERGRADGVL